MADSNPKVLEILMRQLTRSLSLALDLAVFEGSGTSYQPRGLENCIQTNQITTLGADGAVPTDLDVIGRRPRHARNVQREADRHRHAAEDVGRAARSENRHGGDSQRTAVARQRGRRGRRGAPVDLRAAGAAQLAVEHRPRRAASNHASSSIYIGQWDQLVIVRNGDLRIEVDKSRLFNQDMAEVRAILRATSCSRIEKAFARIVGVSAVVVDGVPGRVVCQGGPAGPFRGRRHGGSDRGMLRCISMPGRFALGPNQRRAYAAALQAELGPALDGLPDGHEHRLTSWPW